VAEERKLAGADFKHTKWLEKSCIHHQREVWHLIFWLQLSH